VYYQGFGDEWKRTKQCKAGDARGLNGVWRREGQEEEGGEGRDMRGSSSRPPV
jgi:hypothetical protein